MVRLAAPNMGKAGSTNAFLAGVFNGYSIALENIEERSVRRHEKRLPASGKFDFEFLARSSRSHRIGAEILPMNGMQRHAQHCPVLHRVHERAGAAQVEVNAVLGGFQEIQQEGPEIPGFDAVMK